MSVAAPKMCFLRICTRACLCACSWLLIITTFLENCGVVSNKSQGLHLEYLRCKQHVCFWAHVHIKGLNDKQKKEEAVHAHHLSQKSFNSPASLCAARSMSIWRSIILFEWNMDDMEILKGLRVTKMSGWVYKTPAEQQWFGAFDCIESLSTW